MHPDRRNFIHAPDWQQSVSRSQGCISCSSKNKPAWTQCSSDHWSYFGRLVDVYLKQYTIFHSLGWHSYKLSCLKYDLTVPLNILYFYTRYNYWKWFTFFYRINIYSLIVYNMYIWFLNIYYRTSFWIQNKFVVRSLILYDKLFNRNRQRYIYLIRATNILFLYVK